MQTLPPHSFYTMLAVFALLAIASAVYFSLNRRYSDRDYTELKLRIRSWWIMIAILFSALMINKTTTVIFFAFLSFLALKEFLSIVPLRQSDRHTVFFAYIAIPIQYFWVWCGWYGMFIVFIPVYMFLLLPFRMVLVGDTKGFIRAAGIIHWALMLTVFCLSHVAYLLVLPEKNESAGAIGLVLFVLFLTEFNDICQYVWGKKFGKHKIIPKVSPNKTWEGFLGGIGTTASCCVFVAPFLTPLSMYQGLIAGMLIAGAGFIGDVVISSVKRDLKIKDSGTLIPGHGGILDRMDSLTFTAPLFFHFIYYLIY